MTEGKYNVQFGNVTQSQVVVGDYNTVSQKVGLTPEEAAELKSVFGDLKTAVADQAPEDRRDEALAQAEELEQAVVATEPDPGRIRKVIRWFRDNAPQLAGTVASVVINPLVGKVVEAAGEAIADQFRQVVKEEL
ncbi:MAG: hypothetical protein ACJ76V_00375 [Thermoleophilaceae bacterium]